jgi:RimJ/RimL family protein N-acetyltransferase
MAISFRKAELKDAQLYFDWANDGEVRVNSYQTNTITWEEHLAWFTNKIKSTSASMFIFEDKQGSPIGQVRIEFKSEEHVIGVSVDKYQRGKGYASQIIKLASEQYLKQNSSISIVAYIKEVNKASYFAFLKAGYGKCIELKYANETSFKLIYPS